jgi:hypothetical protein
MHMADEIDAGQERGEVAKRGGDRKSIKVQIPDFDDLGVSKQRVTEWRKCAMPGCTLIQRGIGLPQTRQRVGAGCPMLW